MFTFFPGVDPKPRSTHPHQNRYGTEESVKLITKTTSRRYAENHYWYRAIGKRKTNDVQLLQNLTVIEQCQLTIYPRKHDTMKSPIKKNFTHPKRST